MHKCLTFSQKIRERRPERDPSSSKKQMRREKVSELIERLRKTGDKFGLKMDAKALQKNVKIIVFCYLCLSFSVMLFVYYALGCSEGSHVDTLLNSFPYLNEKRKDANRKLKEMEESLASEERSHDITSQLKQLKSWIYVKGTKLLFAFGIYKLLSIPKLIVFTLIMAIIFKKRKTH